jgi:hypothetical protein
MTKNLIKCLLPCNSKAFLRLGRVSHPTVFDVMVAPNNTDVLSAMRKKVLIRDPFLSRL